MPPRSITYSLEGSTVRHGRLMMTAVAMIAMACKGADAPKRPLGTTAADAGTDPAAGQMANPHNTLSPEAKEALDNGNTLYRAKEYKLALAQYRLAAKLAPAHASPYYGIYMAADKLGNKKLADSALVQVNARAENAAPMFNDSLMKKTHLDPKGATPPKS